ncbi:hypothetical protein H112_04743 [Trichophyton rubrum D6]|uniref:protein-tyrosine-phosphatase n=2 Tax=Trichophyton TaxID=5550 RepID=A0A022W0T9_TRIRU|nr:hypothetical protein H100_04751 [Trichophyton rubrum MR850]EZF41435.1 hypothetical protein H102_04739 [Trichophyton rubrum CBS 100081]EZF52010.1 hypothetical protein H103_04744 [Trichophyton rubrum CBS 288.86]EZF62666.1 hypothetical protein H104_04730 [Trichophyton rubrum CBS 289.86]EZF73290.1 hypothetical protein H105_04761 [Trichophyton soudanense CBS 452.61]EZF83914.1 hypothetical protein H110_04740 [Trichophyton rubrum MR1448]EZG16220.1 hypothetical protein H107_04870 [Trichophyton rub
MDRVDGYNVYIGRLVACFGLVALKQPSHGLSEGDNNHNAYITSLFALRNQDALKEANITHVVSAVGPKERPSAISSLQSYDGLRGHLTLDLIDQDKENIIQHFPQAVQFIKAAIADGGAVLVHWLDTIYPLLPLEDTCIYIFLTLSYSGLGESRSATIVLAYMLYQARPRLAPGDALLVLRGSRARCQPNAGFTEQLALYHQMGCPKILEDQILYQQFLSIET